MTIPQSEMGGPAEFADLDGDGVYEVVTRDWDASFCCHAVAPFPRADLTYRPGKGCVPVSPQFPEALAADLQKYQEVAEAVRRGEFGEGTHHAKRRVLNLALAHLYSGNPDLGWASLQHYYPYHNVDESRAAIEEELTRSGVYTPWHPRSP